MKRQWVVGLSSMALWMTAPAIAFEVFRYHGMCDASAAVAVDTAHFVVADDERNTLVTYRRGQPAPVARLELDAFLGTSAGKESDLEGAAAIGSRIYWISSHGRNKNGKIRQERARFFATDVDSTASPPSLTAVGAPYSRLLEDLSSSAAWKDLGLRKAAKRAPEAEGGLNIEGLAATQDGKLLIGFRNPIPRGRALVLPLENPAEMVAGQVAKFGTPILLDLGGRGIRSLERVGSSYLIVAGPPADNGRFALFRWSGKTSDAPVRVAGIEFGDLHPEALFPVPKSNLLQILSDDGGVETAGIACKDLDEAHRSFRSISVKLP